MSIQRTSRSDATFSRLVPRFYFRSLDATIATIVPLTATLIMGTFLLTIGFLSGKRCYSTLSSLPEQPLQCPCECQIFGRVLLGSFTILIAAILGTLGSKFAINK